MSTLEAQRHNVADAARRLGAAGLVIGSAGNVSEREGELVAITPTGAHLADLMPEQVAVVDLDGAHVDGELAATSELALHLGVYRRYCAGGVAHTHAPMATAVSCVMDELPCIHYQLLLLGGAVRTAPYRTFGTRELAEVTLDALEGRAAALMANHGAIAVGQDARAAVEQSLLLEWGCELYWRAATLGTPRVLDAGEQQAVMQAAVARNYGTTRSAHDDA